MYLGGNIEHADRIQWDECHSFLNPAPLEEPLVRTFVLYDDVVWLAACRDLERRAFPAVRVLGLEREEQRDEAVDLVEPASAPHSASTQPTSGRSEFG